MTNRIAFYAPLKSPHHPIPSGDREIAKNLIQALTIAGYSVEIASETIAYQKRPSPELFDRRRAECEAEARRLITKWQSGKAEKPEIWFTYHPYCKAPDWIGPVVAKALQIPYVTAEACRTRQNTDADWAAGRALVQAAVGEAALNFCLKPSDWAYLESFLPDMTTVTPLIPFIDETQVEAAKAKQDHGFSRNSPLIIAAGMMRPGAKTQSYQWLGEAFRGLSDEAWDLVLIGDGPERPRIEGFFEGIDRSRVHFAGALPRDEVLGWMKAGDMLAWPGVSEAIGFVYLEAQACGLPVVAFDTAGVPIVVANGRSGLLAPAFDIEVFGDNLRRLLRSPEERKAMGVAGRRKIEREHGLVAAASVLRAGLQPLLAGENS